MDLMDQLYNLAITNPKDTIKNLERTDDEHIKIEIGDFSGTFTLDELTQLSKRFMIDCIERTSVYVDAVRYFVFQANKLGKLKLKYVLDLWVNFPEPTLQTDDEIVCGAIVFDDRIVDQQLLTECGALIEPNDVVRGMHRAVERRALKGENPINAWDRRYEEKKQAGWTYGTTFDAKAKTSPAVIPFNDLDRETQDRIMKEADFIDKFHFSLLPVNWNDHRMGGK